MRATGILGAEKHVHAHAGQRVPHVAGKNLTSLRSTRNLNQRSWDLPLLPGVGIAPMQLTGIARIGLAT